MNDIDIFFDEYREVTPKELETQALCGCLISSSVFVAFMLLFVIVTLFGCTTAKVVTVPEVRTDTVQITTHQMDSIWLHDSIHVIEKQKGDTVWMEVGRWHTKYIEKCTHDTIYKSRVDSVPVIVPVEKPVSRPLTWWQKTKMGFGVASMLVILVWVVWQAAMLYMKRF